ncbi:unnamed protein product [Vitrella brassicaformis CCMP3155]|uniref:ATP synthase subunit gamma, mitochondrial n=1 Tax=Vitrella brassicaformis (strain CCMP3155) TaxID=1169540 RepID=A0A0G4FEJ1_VITBC|nr:unnamed protein product [Vitrella brassicaformis CCMP3155]|mmetsp:Transcript_12552/g.29944  ORF Transcript_12552/g.29944 Transcript_12552/m.29944 type:complete len:326 (-) Transcript_12552:1375-2352(-)|eukprot:CEM11655.1 unnamed protein product [Vitrella brassicaformis CCMP3155]
MLALSRRVTALRSVLNAAPTTAASLQPHLQQHPHQQRPADHQVRHFAASEKVVKQRMRSVKSIQKITKAMKMVAASKLKNDQRRLENGMPFAQPVMTLLKKLPQDSAALKPTGKEDTLMVALSSDKGLCGGVNSSVAKLARNTTLEKEGEGGVVRIFGVGDKIRAALERLFADRFARMVSEVTRNPWNFTMACIIATRVLKMNPTKCLLLFNHFKSVISYETTAMPLLTPADAEKLDKRELDTYEFEPETREIWQDIHEFYFACTLYGCMLDNIASEQSARMSAMDNASKNAGEMLDKLTLAYNRARQAKITTELIEIISGASAL